MALAGSGYALQPGQTKTLSGQEKRDGRETGLLARITELPENEAISIEPHKAQGKRNNNPFLTVEMSFEDCAL